MLTLDWPHPDLWPNSRKHRLAVAPMRKRVRADAGWLAKEAKMNFSHMAEKGLHLRITFCPPDRRRRDIDNMLGAMKSQLDGVADVIGVDDSLWSLTLARGDVRKGGAVTVEVIQPMREAVMIGSGE